MLPDRIELSTSPLPMECSTTELRQRARIKGISQKGPYKAGRSLPQGPGARKRGDQPAMPSEKGTESGLRAGGRLQSALPRVDPVPHFSARRRDPADHDFEFDHFDPVRPDPTTTQVAIPEGTGDCTDGDRNTI